MRAVGRFDAAPGDGVGVERLIVAGHAPSVGFELVERRAVIAGLEGRHPGGAGGREFFGFAMFVADDTARRQSPRSNSAPASRIDSRRTVVGRTFIDAVPLRIDRW